MLRLKALGPNGVDLPLPAWTDDHASFLNWALCPDEEVPEVCKKFSPVKANEEHWQAFVEDFVKQDPTKSSYVVLWATPTPTGYALGWGATRIFLHATDPFGPRMTISSWGGDQWNTCMGSILREVPRIFLQQLGIKTERSNETALLPPHGPNTLLLEDAPWSKERLFSYQGTLYRTQENTTHVRRINGGIVSKQTIVFYRWLSHRFRDMARTIPELRAVWLASRINAHQQSISLAHIFSLWRNIQENETLRQTPLLLMAYAANPDNLPGVVPKHFVDFKHSRSFPSSMSWQAWQEVPISLNNEKDEFLYFLYNSTPVHPGSMKASRRLGLSESYRWMSALIQTKPRHNALTQTPPEALLELLLVHAHRIPKTGTLTSMLKSPYPFWAWLAHHTPWASPGQQQPWPNIPNGQDDYSDLYRVFLKQVKVLREYQQRNSVHFQTMARAALAWIKSSEQENRACDEEHPIFVLPQLAEMIVPETTRKERINKRLTWKGVLSLKHFLDITKLATTKDFTGVTSSQDTADASWPTAIGNLRIGGMDVHPLCRPSHLEVMGEFLDNCVQKYRQLDSFVEKARNGESRFFRLSDSNREFLLQISDFGRQAWKVSELRGRNNHAPTTEASTVGQRVADLYTLLSSEEAHTLSPASSPRPRADQNMYESSDSVDIVRGFTHDLDAEARALDAEARAAIDNAFTDDLNNRENNWQDD